jgi:hypothetical protein
MVAQELTAAFGQLHDALVSGYGKHTRPSKVERLHSNLKLQQVCSGLNRPDRPGGCHITGKQLPNPRIADRWCEASRTCNAMHSSFHTL